MSDIIKDVKYLGQFPLHPQIYGLKQALTQKIKDDLEVYSYTYFNTIEMKMYIFTDGKWESILKNI